MADWRFIRNVALKTLLLLVVFNLVFAFFLPLPQIGRLSAYNLLFPGRLRFPFGENPERAYNLSLYSIDAMFASHELTGESKPPGEYRVFLMGDSSVWGTLLKPEDTLAGQLNALHLSRCDGSVRFYNLGYPTLSLFKDVMLLDEAIQYQPDLVLWLVTLQSLPYEKQLESPLVTNNPERVSDLIRRFEISLDSKDSQLVFPGWWQRTIFGQRRALSDLIRFQSYGVLWAATGIDQEYPENYPPAQRDLKADDTFLSWKPPVLPEDQMAWNVIQAGFRIAGQTPVWLINEPMMISTGKNREIRYNFFYPRWAYDQYRKILVERSRREGWPLLDFWNLLEENEFTNSAIHLSPAGTTRLAEQISAALANAPCPVGE